MSASIFCCSSITPFRPRRLDHEAKFTAFTTWTRLQTLSPSLDDATAAASIFSSAPYAVQLVRQVNFGPQESVRYFVPAANDQGSGGFVEVTEDGLVESNFEKLNTYKNFRCNTHNKFFEVNIYQKNPTNAHHWRSNIARPARDIDLALCRPRGEEAEMKVNTTSDMTKVEAKMKAEAKMKMDMMTKMTKAEADMKMDTTTTKAKEAEGESATPAAEGERKKEGGDDDAASVDGTPATALAFLPSREESDKDDDNEPWWNDVCDDDFDYDVDYGYHDASDDGDDWKDFTACDKECGYCGACPY